MQIAPVNSLRLGMLGDGDGFERVGRGDVDVATHEVDEIRAL